MPAEVRLVAGSDKQLATSGADQRLMINRNVRLLDLIPQGAIGTTGE